MIKKHYIFLLVILLTACSPVIRMEQSIVTSSLLLKHGENIGQTVFARFDGLMGVDIFLKPEEKSSGAIQLHLQEYPSENLAGDLRVTVASLEILQSPEFVRFTFAPIKESTRKAYYFYLETGDSAAVQLRTGPGESYIDGSAYMSQIPVENAQLAFRLIYHPGWLAWGLFEEALSWFWKMLVALFLFAIPGWGVLRFIWPGWDKLDLLEKIGLSAGVSLGLYPVVFLWTDWIGVHLGFLYAWLLPITGALIILLQWRRSSNGIVNLRSKAANLSGTIHRLSPETVSGFVVLGLIIATRFWVVRELEIPMWGDSYQHTMITQLIVDNGGLFKSWLPYEPYSTFTIHFGFHTISAVWSWLTNLNTSESVIEVGQITNIIAVMTIYPLAVRLAKGNRWAGVVAIFIAGLISWMPAFYVNWGRYSQLSGQAVLLVAIWLFWDTLNNEVGQSTMTSLERGRKILLFNKAINIFVSGIILAGMTLHYYRMPFFFGAFSILFLILWGIPKWKNNQIHLRDIFFISVGIAFVGIILFLPWLKNVLQGNLSVFLESNAVSESQINALRADLQAWLSILDMYPAWLGGLVIISACWGIIKKNLLVASLLFWPVLVIGYRIGQWINLPAANSIQSFAVMIFLYIPISISGGWLIGEIFVGISKARIRFGSFRVAWILCLMVTITGIWLGLKQKNLIDQQTFALATKPDLLAMKWIKENTPANSIFLVQGFRIYSGFSAVGGDAGWWIPLLALRSNTMPPQYALFNEVPQNEQYSKKVVEIVAVLETNKLNSKVGIETLCQNGITHIYDGQRRGRVGSGVSTLFSTDEIMNVPNFKLVYQQSRVRIFEFERQVCEGLR